MPVARPESSDSRVIAHVDLDCFYVQVEQRKRPDLRGHPAAVVQYNSWKGGGLIAVGYEARKFGVKRSMRGDEANQVCPEIHLVQVPVARGKADLTLYRNAGSEVVSVLARKGRCERASIDEVYLDLTEAAEKMLDESPPESLDTLSEEALRSHILGLELIELLDEMEIQHGIKQEILGVNLLPNITKYTVTVNCYATVCYSCCEHVAQNGSDPRDNVKKWLVRADAERRDKLLACGALIVAELRLQVLQETEFTCSAGIAHNKMLAKLASGMNKPAQQTVVPLSSVKELLENLPIKKMKQLGGKLGTSLQIDLGINTVGDLLRFSEAKLQELYGVNTGTWLWNISRGINGEEVEGRLLPKSHGAGKTFPGPRALRTISAVQKWLNDLCEELNERLCADLEKNKRIAHTLTLHASAYKLNDSESFKNFPSKSCPLRYGIAKIQDDALNLFQAGLREYLGMHMVKNTSSHSDDWGVTGLSVSASKILAIPQETLKDILSFCKHAYEEIWQGTRSISNYFRNCDQTCTPGEVSTESSLQDAAPLLSLGHEGGGSCSQLSSGAPVVKSPDEKEKTSSVFPSSNCEKNEVDLASSDKDITIIGSREDGHCSSYPPSECQNGEELRKKIAHGVRLKDRTTKVHSEKGTSSILKFFPSRVSSTPQKEQPDSIQETASSSSYSQPGSNGKCNNRPIKLNEPFVTDGGHLNTVGSNQNETRKNDWSYRFDEIDHAVLHELPKEIQDEVNAWVRPQKRANTVKRCSTISQFFLPAKGD